MAFKTKFDDITMAVIDYAIRRHYREGSPAVVEILADVEVGIQVTKDYVRSRAKTIGFVGDALTA
ncbi:hypothetical protein H1S01_03100 [Heliobacterium chlorum]|uniref:Uncharacterized protein n=1 Tax=Heliobacterium chlorum TaxID=2698 RepID=A0ABR7SY90_HELCL|nr:hypothetical protein [Heliobacterium chlorum]MBC9783498.1 hypothetical protein [Heliobacterium chlorum]